MAARNFLRFGKTRKDRKQETIDEGGEEKEEDEAKVGEVCSKKLSSTTSNNNNNNSNNSNTNDDDDNNEATPATTTTTASTRRRPQSLRSLVASTFRRALQPLVGNARSRRKPATCKRAARGQKGAKKSPPLKVISTLELHFNDESGNDAQLANQLNTQLASASTLTRSPVITKRVVATWPLDKQTVNAARQLLLRGEFAASLSARARDEHILSARQYRESRRPSAADASGNSLLKRQFALSFETPTTNWLTNATVGQEDSLKYFTGRRRSYDEQEGDTDISIIMQVESRNRKQNCSQLALARSLLDLDYSKTVQLFISKSSLNWNFNSFTFDALCCGRSLTELLLHLFDYYNLYNIFNLNIINVLKCFRLLEFGYHNSNPYHNSIHAADVTQAMHCFIEESKIKEHLTHLETLCSILAAVCHDLDHPGVNQAFLVATNNPLVGLYNNNSVLENHHWHFALAIFKESAIFDHLSADVLSEFKQQLKTLILATDIAHQNEYLHRFKTLTSSSKFSMLDANDRSLVLQMALKCADLGNPCRPWILSKCWSEQICSEFYRQGDFERRLALQLTPMCQRRKASVASIQTDFFRIIVLPLLELWHTFLRSPLSRILITNLNANYERWQKANRIVQQMRRRKSFASYYEPFISCDDEIKCNQTTQVDNNIEKNDDDDDDNNEFNKHNKHNDNDYNFDFDDNNKHKHKDNKHNDSNRQRNNDNHHHQNQRQTQQRKSNAKLATTINSNSKQRFNSQLNDNQLAVNVRRKAISDLVKSDNERLHNLRTIHLNRMVQRTPKFVA